MTQIAPMRWALPVDAFDLVSGDTDLTADAGKTSASRQTFVSGKAARTAPAAICAAQILRLANAGPEAALSLEGAKLTVRDGGEVRAARSRPTARHVLDRARAPSIRRPRRSTPTARASPMRSTASPRRWPRSRSTCELGTVKVLQIVAAHDVGAPSIPTLVEGQIDGGIAQGLGLALMEEFLPAATENLHDYLIPTIGDVPPVECDPDRGCASRSAPSAPRASASRR